MTSTISFQQRVQIIEEPTLLPTEETTEKVIGVKVSKIGNQPATAKVSFTGSSTSTKDRYLDRAFKSSKPDGDFTASTQTLEWGDEVGVQEAKFTLKGDRKQEGV